MHPVLEEFCRARELRSEVFRRMQRVFATEIQGYLDDRERLIAENAALLEELRRVKTQIVPRRGPGRPRKVQPDPVAVDA
jgi:hypothetical protein